MGAFVSLKRLEFWIAAIALLAAIVAGTNEIISQLNIIKSAVLPKPLEGIWDYSMTYDFFYGEQGLWSANVKGIIMWRVISKVKIRPSRSIVGARLNLSGKVVYIKRGNS